MPKNRIITKSEVEHVTLLARIELAERDVEYLVHQLNSILEYFQKLSQLDTETVEPTTHVLDLGNVFREDEIRPSLDCAKILDIAPDVSNNFFKVPAVLR